MHFSNKLEDEEYITLEAVKLDNNILMEKQNLDENQHYVVKLKENQSAILFEKGQVYDVVKEEGIYTINLAPNSSFPGDLIEYQQKENQDRLCVIFFNMKPITKNKFYIPKKHRKSFYGEGEFEFQIVNPLKLFNKVVEIRKNYSREELLEQIRERLTKNVITVIKQQKNEYGIKEETMNASVDVFKEYGIKINLTDIKKIQFQKKM